MASAGVIQCCGAGHVARHMDTASCGPGWRLRPEVPGGSLTPPRSPQVQQQGVYAYRRQASNLASNLLPEYLGYACRRQASNLAPEYLGYASRRQTSQSTCANSQIGPTSTRRDLFPVHFERNFDSPDSFGVAHRHTLTQREKICSMERLFGHLKEISGICKTAEIP